MIPRVRIERQDGNTGVVRPGSTGILAIVAASADGDFNAPTMHNNTALAKTEFSWGPLTEIAGLVMPQTHNPALLVRADVSTPGAYGSFTQEGGTGTASAGATEPYDAFDVLLTFAVPTPGTITIGTTGASYTVSLDGGKTKSKAIALGTDDSILIVDTNVTVELAAGNIIDGETVAFKTTRPLSTNADLPASLEALRTTSSPFESVLIDCEADDDTVGLVADWLLELNGAGKFPTAFLTCRPIGPTETETEYKDAMALLFAESACVDLVLCADEADMVSVFRGVRQARPAGVSVAARAMAIDIGTEPAFVELGPLPGVKMPVATRFITMRASSPASTTFA